MAAFQHHCPRCMLAVVAVAAAALLFSQAAQLTAATTTGPGDVAVYWGRHKDEGTLREACNATAYTTVVISFLSAFGHGTYTLDLSGHPVSGVGADIDFCRSKGKLVLLSIGGPGGQYWLPSAQAATDVADYLWNAFLAGDGSSTVTTRPFGAAQVDGIDFFIDQGATEHYDVLARRLDGYNRYYRGGGITLTATPRCAYPDARLQGALATGLFDRIHVRMFGGGDDLRCEWGQFDSWDRWAKAYPASRVFVGVVASPEADHDAYMSQKDLYYGILQFANQVPNYGGLMIWDRYYDEKNHYMV